jgi:hypothetical protein
MKLSLRHTMIAGLATMTIAGSIALAATGAQAFSSRDCKLYGHCDDQGYMNSYGGGEAAAPRNGPRQPAPAFQMREETGISGPHGVGW